MQIKGDILMKRGFSLLAAIFFVVVISSLGILALELSMASMRQTTEIYLREQAELLGQGATEMAMLEIFNHDFSKGCPSNPIISDQNFNDIFNYSVYVHFFGQIGNCDDGKLVTDIQTPQSIGTVRLDVFVTTKTKINSEGEEESITPNPISFHKRTLQKL